MLMEATGCFSGNFVFVHAKLRNDTLFDLLFNRSHQAHASWNSFQKIVGGTPDRTGISGAIGQPVCPFIKARLTIGGAGSAAREKPGQKEPNPQ